MHKKQVNVNGIGFIINIPDFCPHCGKIMEAEQITNTFDRISNKAALVFRCTSNSCKKYFILEYHLNMTGNSISSIGDLIVYDYNGFQDINISEQMKSISPIFVETYRQSLIAESKNLNNIVGISLRKAFEFLIKDYAIYNNPDASNDIKKLSLHDSIKNYYSDMPLVESMALIIKNIGNDETHYYRKYTDIDIKDLKMLITNFMLYINMVFNIKEYSEKTS